jgi:GxxExxY protein
MIEPTIEHNRVAMTIVDAAFKFHTALGPGLLESAYEQCLSAELATRAISFQRQVGLPIVYQGERIEGAYRRDLVVAGLVVVEVEARENPLPVHRAQLLTYLKLARYNLGLLINFKHGITRFVRTH